MTFAEFVSAQQRPLLRFAMVLTGDAHMAEDIVADVLARAYERWNRIGAMSQPGAYVRRMIVNEHVSWWRRWARAAPRAEIAIADPPVPDPATRYAEREAMAARLATLPRRQRAALVLRYYEGLSDEAIAETLGCTAATVRSHVSHALATLRIDLAAEDAAPGQVRGRQPRGK